MKKNNTTISRRDFLYYSAAFSLLTSLKSIVPAYALEYGNPGENKLHNKNNIDLVIERKTIELGNKKGNAITLNGSIPGPIVRLKEGEDITINVTNYLDEDTSVHWHGILLPFHMDGVPGVTYPGIKPGETFIYKYHVRQNGTYWYHSHSGVQEQSGHYGPLVIDPLEPDPFEYDREYVVMLSDWTFDDPEDILKKLKSMSDYFNYHRRTISDFFHDIDEKGFQQTVDNRLAWGKMRMNPSDIADVTGHTYTYLMNGMPPELNWTCIFKPGEKVRLRFINGSAMTYFNIRIPGLKMKVVQADGQNVQPVNVDEFQISVAETYDVIVEPGNSQAYTIFAESMDRSGYTRGTLSTQRGLSAPVPELRKPPYRTMIDMGMDMSSMEHGMMKMGNNSRLKHGSNDSNNGSHNMMHNGHKEDMQNMKEIPGIMDKPGPIVAHHGPDHHGPGNISVATVERNRLGEPGAGLENIGHRVLVYNDLRSIKPGKDKRKPEREIEVHLTGNMEKYMWSFDGKKFSEVKEPILFNYGERLRLTMVNDTMMEHPIHLHGMFMELDNGSGDFKPRKHTISVKPAERVSLDITADEPGNWAFHCHLLYHMEAGMFRVVNVSSRTQEKKNGV